MVDSQTSKNNQLNVAFEAPVNNDERHQIHVKIYSPFKTYFDDFAKSISALNKTGPFDILPLHHNFITLLLPGDIKIRTLRGGEDLIHIDRGVLLVKANNVLVFLNI